MSGISGFSNQKKFGTSQFQSVIPVGSNKNASPTPQLYLTENIANPIAITNVALSDDQKKVYLEIVGHGARVNDVLRFTSGNLIAWEFDICEVFDGSTLSIWNVGEDNEGNTVIPALAEEAKTYRWVTATSSPDGALTVSPGPVKFVDGTEKTVTPADPLPVTNALTVKEYNSLDISGLGSGAWVELTTTTDAIKKLQIFSPTDKAIYIGLGAIASEIATAIVFPGGCDIELAIPAGERVSVQTVTGTVAAGTTLYANLLG